MKTTPVLFALGVLVLAGCTNRSTEKPKETTVQVTSAKPRTDPLRLASDLMRQATEPGQFREALNVLNPALDSSKLALDDTQREFLRTEANLSPAELGEVESNTLVPPDAYYVEECCLLRDAAQALEVTGLSLPEQAHLAFRWVARNVLLHEQGDDWLPNAFTLRSGHGNGRARALVFLALMRQFQGGKQAQVEGCVLTLPGANPTPLLVGLFDEASKDLYLFDPRLGEPVFKDRRAVATLRDVQQNPDLLKTSGISASQLKDLQALLACPLPALSPRIREVERLLSTQDRIKVAMDPQALQQTLAAAGIAVRVWNEPADKGSNSPTRALHRFLPPEEGGTDRTVPTRLQRFALRRLPRTRIALALDQLKLTQDLNPDAFTFLTERLIGDLFRRYAQQPHEMLLHGQHDQMISRRDRTLSFLDDESSQALSEDKQFQKDIAAWREKANKVYLAKLTKDERAKGLELAFWNEDQYIATLMSDAEDAADQGRGSDDRPKKIEKGTLTRIVSYACREPLQQRMAWLFACSWQDRAERAEAAADADRGNKLAAEKARRDWLSARGAWNEYLRVIALTPSSLRQRLELVQRLRGRDPDQALGLLEAIHADLHRVYAAKFYVGAALAHVDGNKSADAFLRNVTQEIDALVQAASKDSSEGWPSLKQEIDRLQPVIASVGNPALRSYLQQRADLLARDWTEPGNFTWLRRQYALAASQ